MSEEDARKILLDAHERQRHGREKRYKSVEKLSDSIRDRNLFDEGRDSYSMMRSDFDLDDKEFERYMDHLRETASYLLVTRDGSDINCGTRFTFRLKPL